MWHDIKPLSFIALKNNSKNPWFTLLSWPSLWTVQPKRHQSKCFTAQHTVTCYTLQWSGGTQEDDRICTTARDAILCMLVGGLTDQSASVGWSTYMSMEALQILVMVLEMYISSARNVSLGCLHSCDVAQQYRSVTYADYHHYAFGYFTNYTFELWF